MSLIADTREIPYEPCKDIPDHGTQLPAKTGGQPLHSDIKPNSIGIQSNNADGYEIPQFTTRGDFKRGEPDGFDIRRDDNNKEVWGF